MRTETRKITASECLQLPVSNLHHELIHGEGLMAAARTGSHQRILLETAISLKRLIPNGEVLIARVDVYPDDLNVVQPDIM